MYRPLRQFVVGEDKCTLSSCTFARSLVSYHHAITIMGRHEPLLALALALESAALKDDYFAKRKLFPNVDFYSGIGMCPTISPSLVASYHSRSVLATITCVAGTH